MTLTCAIIDDEPLARDLIESYIEKTPFLELKGKYSSAITAFKDLAHDPVDLVFLDIQMPDLNGMDMAHMIPASMRVVFTTAFPEYAVEAYRANAIDYLLKPISYNNFLEAANKALRHYELRQNQQKEPARKNVELQLTDSHPHIFVKSDYKLFKIDLDDILYIQGLKDYMKIYLRNSDEPIMTLVSMKIMEERLPKNLFMRVHRSFIVNTRVIDSIERNQIVIGDVFIPISEGYKNAVQQYISEHLI